jgi:8-oxo-dGTP pyrophosphatase MutT (NUDIX family)
MFYIMEDIKRSMTRRANYTIALKDSLANNAYTAGYDAEVASVAVMNGDLLLMGKRRDNGKWTLPGGHLDPGETPHDGGLRELYEESGIEAQQLVTLGQRGVLTDRGKFVMVYAYYLPVSTKVTTRLDPDQEISEWRWFDTKNGLPKHVLDNLHVSRNFVLNCLGLQKSEVVKSMPGAPRAGHKYLRRYKSPSGKWVYVYHEGESHGRVVPEEAVHSIRKLAELGDQHAHAIYTSLQDHSEEKLNILRELGNHGDQDAIRHLKKLGIDHAADKEEREAAEIERALFKERDSNPLTKPLKGAELTALHADIKTAVDGKIFSYLRNHVGTEPERKLREAGITLDTIMQPVLAENTVNGALKRLHESLKAIDRAHKGVRSSNSWARDAGGYANLGWNTALDSLRDHHIIPESMHNEQVVTSTSHRRIDEMDPGTHAAAARGLAEQRRQAVERVAREAAEREEREARAAREAAEREERERRENAEALSVHQESITDMISYFGASVSPSEHPNIAKNIQKFWGRDFKFKNFVKHLNPGRDEKTEIKIGEGFLAAMRREMSGRRMDFAINFKVFEKRANREITSASRHIYKEEDGSITWSNGSFSRASNEDLKKFPGMGRGLYKGVEGFLKEITANWTGEAKENTRVIIGTCANSGWGNGYKGTLVWAKHCFDWSGGRNNSSAWRGTWNTKIDEFSRAINMPASQVAELKAKVAAAEYPHQFVNTGFVVTKQQAEAMVGRRMDFDFDQIFENKGYCDIGDLIIIDSGVSWSGENYLNKTTGRAGALNEVRTAYYAGTTSASTPIRVEGAASARGSASADPPTGQGMSAASMSREELTANGWTISGDGNAQVAHIGPLATAEATIRRLGPTRFGLITARGQASYNTLREAFDAANRSLGRTVTEPTPATHTSSVVAHWMRRWPRTNARGQSRITITPQRLRRILARSDAEVGEFMRATISHVTPQARKRIREAMRAAGRSPA